MKICYTVYVVIIYTKMKKILLIFSIICVFFNQSYSSNKQKNVLLLNSYHNGYSWTDRLTLAIKTNLVSDKFEINLSIEYLDSKRIKPDSEYFHLIKEFLSEKYKNTIFDLIITSDDDAFYFLLKYHDELFPNVPVISCGLGIKNKQLVDKNKYFTAVYDDFFNDESFFNSLKLLPEYKNIVFISDVTTTGKSSMETMKKLTDTLKEISPIFITDDSIEDIITKLKNLPPNTIIYPLVFNYDKKGRFYSHSDFIKILAQSVSLPIIATLEDHIGKGAIGGYVLSANYHGKITSNLALRVLEGEKIKSVSYPIDSIVIPVFDNNYIKKFGIAETLLPKNSRIINKERSFFEENKTLVIYVTIAFVSLLIVIFILTFNIIKRKQTEIKLRKFSIAVEQSPVSIVITDINGIIEYVNPRFTEITGYSFEEVLGKRPSILKSGKTPIEIYKNMWETITSGNDWRGEVCNKKKNGELYWEYVSISPLFDEKGNITHFIGVKEDITIRKNDEKALKESKLQLESTLSELKRTQAQILQQERLRSIGQMASGIAHDINNSLMPILGYADLLLYKKNLDPSLQSKIQSIKTASLDIKRTIERMKEFYKPSSNESDFQNLKINDIVFSVIEFTKHRWKDIPESTGNVISITTQLDENLPEIKGNETEIREALTNIILNSADALPDGGDIIIRTFMKDSSIFIEIIDTGIGMDEDTLKHCLDPFFTTKGEKGTGLGLSMVYGIIQRHKGCIDIKSKKGAGTTITISLPICSDEQITISKEDNYNIKSIKILCIDDNKEARDLLYTILYEKNHKVTLSESGKEGLKEFYNALENNNPYDLVITDLGMPHMDGKSVAEAIKSKSPNTPIILITGWGAFVEPNTIKTVDYILKKPITAQDLFNAISKVINK